MGARRAAVLAEQEGGCVGGEDGEEEGVPRRWGVRRGSSVVRTTMSEARGSVGDALTSPRLYEAGRVESSEGLRRRSVKPVYARVDACQGGNMRVQRTGEVQRAPEVVRGVREVVASLGGLVAWAVGRELW